MFRSGNMIIIGSQCCLYYQKLKFQNVQPTEIRREL